MPQLMTVRELGEYLRFTKRTIYRLLKQGGIPALKIGNKWRFEQEAIDRWLGQQIHGTKARVLVIDDDDFVTSLFREVLAEQGFTVATARTSAEGIEYVKRGDFDLVFLDLRMPDVDGAETLKTIRGIAPALPVTIITGYPDSEMMARALKHGPVGVMEKPFNDSDIIAAVNSFFLVAPLKE